MSPSLAVAGTPSAALSASPRATHGQLVRRFAARGHVLGARGSALPVVRRPPVRLLRERRVLARHPVSRLPARRCKARRSKFWGPPEVSERSGCSDLPIPLRKFVRSTVSFSSPKQTALRPNQDQRQRILRRSQGEERQHRPHRRARQLLEERHPLLPAQLVAGFPFIVQSALA